MTTTAASKPLTVTTCANVVTMAASVVAGAKGITVAPGASGSPLTLGTATATVRQVPATVVTTQTVRALNDALRKLNMLHSFGRNLHRSLQGPLFFLCPTVRSYESWQKAASLCVISVHIILYYGDA